MNIKSCMYGLALITILMFVFLAGCTDKYKPVESIFSSIDESSCTHCHLNAATLEEVADPLPPDPGHTGEG
ncbi:MAG: hypothetical protein V2J62_07460 [candidate division KSB1 bacterium]|nr:hypothetical protein [candidate division KSB1 bacterium]